ncbi:MAG: helix-turn-helix domain-containing protein [Methylovirgula sp.]
MTRALRPREVAERWQCSERHIRNLIRAHALKSFRLGAKLIRIPEEAVEEYERCNLTFDLSGGEGFAVEWYDETGRRFRRSLGTSDRGEAKRRVTDEFIPAFDKASRPTDVTVAYAWDLYRAALGAKPAAVTMGHERKAIGAHFGEMAASTVSEADCQSYIRLRRDAGRKDGTIWTELGHLRSALRYAAGKKLIAEAPKIYRPERPAPRDKRMTREEILRFLDACEFPHIKLFAILAITTAARSGALLGLTWDRVDLDAGTSNSVTLVAPGPTRGAPWCR